MPVNCTTANVVTERAGTDVASRVARATRGAAAVSTTARTMNARASGTFGALASLAFGIVAAAASLWSNPASAANAASCEWPGYRTFVERFVQADGRVIDYSTPTQKTTSEGQSYAMFFALVANDRATFDRLLGWTRTNLAGNQFDADNMHLPAWQWGRKQDGSYGVLDPNSASDSDLWIAYDLLQAGRLWRDTTYTKLGEALSAQIVR